MGRDRQRVLHLWLETARHDPLYRRRGDGGSFLPSFMAGDVPCGHRLHLWLVVGTPAGVLKRDSIARIPWFLRNVRLAELLPRQRARAGIDGVFAKQLFDAQELVVF